MVKVHWFDKFFICFSKFTLGIVFNINLKKQYSNIPLKIYMKHEFKKYSLFHSDRNSGLTMSNRKILSLQSKIWNEVAESA